MRLKELYVGMRVHWTDPDRSEPCDGDGKIVDIGEDDVILVTKDAGGEVECHAQELSMIKGSMDDKIRKALRHVYNVIGTDLGWDVQLPRATTVREVVADSMHPKVTHGADPEAVATFCRLPAAERSRILTATFP